MKNFFLNVLATFIAFVMLWIGVHISDERAKKKEKEEEKKFKKEVKDDLEVLKKRESKKKGS